MPRKKIKAATSFIVDLGTTPAGESVEIDVAAMISSRVLVCANSGGGKSYLLRKLIELVAVQVPTLVIDPDGEFASLRELIDLVLVGPTGEIPASPATAAKLARRLVEHRVNAVIDLSSLQLADKQLFVKNFLDALLTLPRELWSRTFVVIDEAHKFASTEQSNVVSATSVISLMDQGRKRRLCGVLATQRLSKLLASARAEANNIFIGRTAQDLDLKRAVDLLGLEKRDWSLLKSAKPGDFYGYGPAFLRQDGVLQFRTKQVVTTHEDDESAPQRTPRPSSSILRVVAEFADLQQEVDRERDELAQLRRENAQLREEARRNPRAVVASKSAPAPVEAYRREGFDQGWVAHREHMQRGIRTLEEVILAAFVNLAKSIETPLAVAKKTLHEAFVNLAKVAAPPPGSRPKLIALPKTTPSSQAPTVARAPMPTSANGGELGKGAAFKLICALVQHGRMTRSKAAFIAGVRPTTGTFRNALSTLRVEGLMADVGDGEIEATEAARARFSDVAELPSNVIDFWRGKLGNGAAGKLFSVLVEEGAPLSREEAASRAEILPTTGTFRNALSTLRISGLMTDVGDGSICLSKELLEFTPAEGARRAATTRQSRPAAR